MGTSPNIKQLGATNAEFQKYIDDRTKELDKATTSAKAEMEQSIKQFYSDGGWELGKPLVSGGYQHLTTVSRWSLDHVSQMIQAIQGSIFGGKAIAQKAQDPTSSLMQIGTDAVPSTDSTLKKSLVDATAMVAGPEAMIAAAAFDAIQGILATFTSVTTTEIVKNTSQKQLLPGLDIWVTVMQNGFHREDFFKNETIIQNFYLFDARISEDRGKSIIGFDEIQAYAAMAHGWDDQLKRLAQAVEGLDIMADDYTDQTTFIGKKQDAIQTQLDDVNKHIAALESNGGKDVSA